MRTWLRGVEPGFTLIELLVVIGILALLAALSLPAFYRARRSAKSAVCMSNLRELGTVLNLYLSDSGDFQNRSSFAPNDWGELRFYLPKDSSPTTWPRCPVTPGLFYSYNGLGTESTAPLSSLGLSGEPDLPLPESGVLIPGEMLAFLHSPESFARPFGFGWPGVPAPAWTLHSGGDTAVFCDAHVETSDPKRIPTKRDVGEFIPDGGHAKRWNYDNQPHPETWPSWQPRSGERSGSGLLRIWDGSFDSFEILAVRGIAYALAVGAKDLR